MRVLGVLAAWGVLAVLATLCFAVGGSIGYRRGVQDAVRQLRERRSGKTGCRPMPLPHHRRRPVSRIRLRTPVSAQRVTARSEIAAHGGARRARIHWSPAAVGALVAVCLLTVPGVAVGATAAQPGDTLWNVKRGMEHARLVMAIGPSRDAVIHADLAARRLTELNQLLSMGGADPQVVDTVIGNLRDHTESATDQLNQTAVTDRAAVAERLDGLVERQIAVIDLLLGVDCAEQADAQCVALTDTREASVRLQRTTTAIAAAERLPGAAPAGPAPATEEPSDAVAGVAPSQVESAVSASAATSEPASEAASTGTSTAPSETPSSTPSTPDTGDGTSETADDGSSGSSNSSDTPSNPEPEPPSSAGSGNAASRTADTLGSELKDATNTAEKASDTLLP